MRKKFWNVGNDPAFSLRKVARATLSGKHILKMSVDACQQTSGHSPKQVTQMKSKKEMLAIFDGGATGRQTWKRAATSKRTMHGAASVCLNGAA